MTAPLYSRCVSTGSDGEAPKGSPAAPRPEAHWRQQVSAPQPKCEHARQIACAEQCSLTRRGVRFRTPLTPPPPRRGERTGTFDDIFNGMG